MPTIYFYLISGSAWLIYMLTDFAGVLLGSWVAPRHGQGRYVPSLALALRIAATFDQKVDDVFQLAT